MKSLMTGTRTLAMGLMVILTFALSAPALAIDNNKKTDGAIPVELKYRGLFKDQPTFELVFGNTDEREYTITIRDARNEVFHKERVKGVQLSRYFSLNKEEIGNRALEFVVYCRQTNETVVYKVGWATRVVEDVAISKVK